MTQEKTSWEETLPVRVGDLLVSKTANISIIVNKIEGAPDGSYFFWGILLKADADIQTKLWLRAGNDSDFKNILDAWTIVR